MAIDQPPTTSLTDPSPKPAIDNEFLTYRAISSTAVLSLVFGLASVFSFASLWFLILVGISSLLGLYSIRKIQRVPDVLTGTGLARVGIGVGLLFGLTAVTQVVMQEVSVNIDAGKYARFYVGVIKDQPVSMALWYQQPAPYRKEKSPDDLVEELKKNRSPMGGDAYQVASRPIVEIKERLDGGKGGEIAYQSIETNAIDGLTTYANALIKLDLKGTKEHPETAAFALFRMVKAADEWIIKEINFPYTPKSAIATVEKHKDDDGHGH